MSFLQRLLAEFPKATYGPVGRALLLTVLLLHGLSDAHAAPLDERIRAALLNDHIHGVTAEIAERDVGEAGVPVLLDLLAEPDFPRRDNVVAFLTYLGGERATQGILNFLRSPPASVTIPEEDRALLLAPQALGHIAARGHPAALRALLAMTAQGSGGGVLSRAAARGPAPEALRDDLLEMALRGLAYCQDEAAAQRILEIAEGSVVPAPGGRSLEKAAASARGLFESLTGPPGPGGPPDDPIASLTQQATDPATDTHEHKLDYANHVDHDDPMTDTRLDQLFAEANTLIGISNFAEDVACCNTLIRKGTAQTFGSPGDGLDVIDDLNEQIAVQLVNIARVKVVRIINFCGAPGTNIIGCAGVSGNFMALVRRTNLTSEAILWAHEYGHNVGLNHNADSRFIMHGTNTGSNEALDAAECDKFHNPSTFTQADMSVTGPCVQPVCGNGTCEFGETCGSCSADCISGGFTCGNGICEAGNGEDCVSCDLDCNGVQSGNPAGRFCCGDGDGDTPVPCSDPLCSTMGWQCTDVPNNPYCCGDLTCEGMETSLNCAVDCGAPPLETWVFFGTAQGGTIDYTISGVVLQVITTAGETAAQVAANVAAAINNDPTLSAMGVTATAIANQVTTNGTVDSSTINDPGLSHGMPEIPALSPTGLALCLLVLAIALVFRRRRGR